MRHGNSSILLFISFLIRKSMCLAIYNISLEKGKVVLRNRWLIGRPTIGQSQMQLTALGTTRHWCLNPPGEGDPEIRVESTVTIARNVSGRSMSTLQMVLSKSEVLSYTVQWYKESR